jgi:large subunit ribosomal protein L4
MKVDILNLDAKNVGSIELDDSVFGANVREDIMHRCVAWQRNKARAGTHATKTVSQVSGTTAKPYNQKGTGRARQGTLRATQFRGGGISHGPVPHSHATALPKKVRRLALRSALSAKQAAGQLIVLEEAKLNDPKTKALVAGFKKLGLTSALIVDGPQVDENFALAARNIVGIDVLPSVGANVYDILRRQVLVLTKDAVNALEARLK